VKGRGTARRYARGTLVLLIALAGLFIAFRTELARVPFEPIHRLASLSLTDPTVSSRLFIWRTVSQEAMNRPLLGYGAEHVSTPFDRVYDPSVMTEEWFDRSHNAYLDYFVQFGIGGLLLYLALIALILRTGWRLFKAGNRHGLFLIGIAGTYAIQNFFVFDTAMTFWLLLALAATALVQERAQEAESPFALGSPRLYLGALAAALLLALIIPVSLSPLRANLLAFEAYQYQVADLPRAKAAAEAGLALNTYADLEFGYNAYFIYTEEQVHRLTGEDLHSAYTSAALLLTYSFNRYPYDARTAVYLAQVLSLAPPGIASDRALLASALERSIRLSPKRAQPWYILANLSISDANAYPAKSEGRAQGYAAARDLLSRYVALVPTLAAPHFVLAQLLFASGDAKAAADEAALGKAHYREDLETARRAAMYYETVLDLKNAAFFLTEVIRLNPSDTAAADDLRTIQSYEQSKK
ncbi:MAG: O-antigen ligase family protein, partial [Candidatus Pacebacteria bacterium]|nr:O-antigen ligase family protein [Candidatus Paceibacterota bacterium]